MIMRVNLLRMIATGLMVFFAFSSAWAEDKKRIIVINSYHYGFSWSDEEQAGLTGRLQEVYPDIDIPVEYLDAKRYSDERGRRHIRDFLIGKYEGERIDLVVALDDPALDLLTQYRDELFPGVPVVFAGVAVFNQTARNRRSKMTGVIEKQNIKGTIELALSLHPNAREVMVINDGTVSGVSARRQTELLVPLFSGRVKFSFLPSSSFEEASKLVAALPKDTIILLNSYTTDRTGKALSTKDSSGLIVSAARGPVYGVHENRLGDGIVGGYLLGGRDHGRKVAEFGIRVLKGEDPDLIPVDDRGTARPMFDYAKLRLFGIDLKNIPKDSIVINKPASVFETNREFAVGIMVVVTLLAIMVSILFIVVIRLKRAETALRNKTGELDRIFNLSPDLLCISDMFGRLIRMNPAWSETLGYSLNELEGRVLMDFVHPEDVPAALKAVECLSEGIDLIDYTNRFRCKDGSYRWIEWRATPYKYSLIYTVARDITHRIQAAEEQERLKELLFQSQKMETIGMLAGGVAHDFNNLLTPILGYSELMMNGLPEGDPQRLKLMRINQAANLAKELTWRLLAFSRKQILELKVVNVGDIIKGFARMAQSAIRENIRLNIDISPQLGLVRADKAQIEQALLNLLVNAQDAMHAGGLLSIKAGNVELDESYTLIHPEAPPGPYVMILVSDNGVGMDEETRSHIFEPFFTTKELGRGTGLGLATVYGIVKQHGGSISVYSETGNGSVFRVFLPRVTEEGAMPDDCELIADKVETGDETILVAEDNETVRTLICSMLKSMGYKTLAATGSAHCIEIVRMHSGPIHLLLADVVMPEKNGKELYELLKRERPDMKALFMSGYTGDSMGGQGIEGVRLLQKPFTITELSQMVRRAIES